MKKLLPTFLMCFLSLFIKLRAQTTVLSTFPTHSSKSSLIAGMSFEVSTSEYIHLKNIHISLLDVGDSIPIDLYYKSGSVQPAPGTPPTIPGGLWTYWGKTYVNAMHQYTPAPTGDINLFLPPGNYSFYFNSPGKYFNFKNFGLGGPSSFTDANGVVTLISDTATCYGGNLPTPSFHTQFFIGGIEYYSFTKTNNDITVYNVISPNLDCSGNNMVTANLRNYGMNKIDSVKIHWSVDGVLQNTVNYDMPIDTIGGSGSYEAHVNLGLYNFTGQDHEIIVWTSLPNGVTDGNKNNDTTTYHFKPSMNGIYTIDSNITSATNFKSFKDAVAKLLELGVCGPVTFNVKEGIYNQHISIDTIPGTSALNTVTFQSDPNNTGKAELIYECPAGQTDSNYVLKLNGCRYVTFDNIRMESQGNDRTIVIVYENGAKYNTIMNCEIISRIVSSISSTSHPTINVNGDSRNSHNIIKDNYIFGGSYGIRYRGSSSSDIVPGVVISGNTIVNPFYYGIYAYYTDGIIISDNTISSNSVRTTSFGMRLSNADNGMQLTGNTIMASQFWPRQGISIASAKATATKRGLIANNMIHAGDASNSSTSVAGLDVTAAVHTDIVHNNIVVEGTGATSSAAIIYGDHINFFNNNVIHYGAGTALQLDSNVTIISDYNNLANSGFTFSYYDGGRGGVLDLASWQLTGQDLHSISADSIFSNLDSLRTCDSRIVKKGTWLAYSTSDIDEESRNFPSPNIGADEYETGAVSIDIGDTITICAGDQVELKEMSGNIKYGNYLWNTNDTTRSITASSAGIYTLNITACVTATDEVEIIEIPAATIDFKASFTDSSLQKNYTVNFTNLSTNGTGYLWDFGDGKTSTSMNDFHTYDSTGTYMVILTVFGPCDTLIDSIEVTTYDYVGIAGHSLDNQVKVYPNPVKDILNIQINQLDNKVTLEIFDITGQLLMSAIIQPKVSNGNLLPLDVSAFKDGIYLLKLTSADESMTKRFIKQ